MTTLAIQPRDRLQVAPEPDHPSREARGRLDELRARLGSLSENERLELHSFLDIGEGNQIRGMEVRSKDGGRR